jgi:methyl-accepting chemotaxis protein
MNAIETLRAKTTKLLAAYICLQAPLILVVDFLVNGGLGWMSAIGVAIAVATGVMAWVSGGPALRYFLSAALMLMVATIVATLAGNPWQIDAHMYFFAALAMLTVFCDWPSILVATVTVALHHLILNFALPAVVFPGGGDFGRVVLHAVVVLIEAGVLIWLSRHLAIALSSGEAALADAQKAHEEAEAIAQRERAKEVEAQGARSKMLNEIAGGFERTVSALVQDVTSHTDRAAGLAKSMSQVARENSSKAVSAAHSSTSTTQDAQTIAAAAEELSASVLEIQRQVQRSTDITNRAVQEATATSGSVQELSEAAEKIGDIIRLISEIASQTNLLALNATIEAARAGEAGKGFAVVASEVKNLANQTAKATDEISSQITAIQGATSRSAGAIQSVASTIREVSAIVETINASVEQQGTATREIAQTAQNVSRGTAETSSIIEEVRRSADETGATAGTVTEAAENLVGQSEKLRSEIDKFVRSLQAS